MVKRLLSVDDDLTLPADVKVKMRNIIDFSEATMSDGVLSELILDESSKTSEAITSTLVQTSTKTVIDKMYALTIALGG